MDVLHSMVSHDFEIVPQEAGWVRQAKRNLTALYENRPLERMPFEFAGIDITGDYEPKAGGPPATPRSLGEVRREFLDPAFQLRSRLAAIAKRVREGCWDDRIMAIHPISSATGWMTEVFGGQTAWFTNRPPFQHAVINEASQIDKLRPDFQQSELYEAALQQMRFFRKVVGDRIPIGPPDLQSPVDVASMILDYTQLVYAMMDEPQRVHALLRMVTEATIQACRVFRQEMTDYALSHFNWWLPRGIFLSDDLQAVLNADLYREFAVPYNEMLAAEFGGLALHSCGRIVHNLENVAGTKGLLAFNTHDPLGTVAPIVQNRVAVIVGGVEEVVAPNHPQCKRPQLKTAAALEQFWWEDSAKLPTVKGQRVLYQCDALLHKRTVTEAYERMQAVSKSMAGHAAG